MGSITTGRIRHNTCLRLLQMLKPGPLTAIQLQKRLNTNRTYIDKYMGILVKQGKVRKIHNELEAPGKWAFKLVEK